MLKWGNKTFPPLTIPGFVSLCSERNIFTGEILMAVQKDRVTRSRRGMRRAHDALSNPTLAIDDTTGETHRRHHITKRGYYRGREVMVNKITIEEDNG
jgi:large subunit ribosomal protein L32